MLIITTGREIAPVQREQRPEGMCDNDKRHRRLMFTDLIKRKANELGIEFGSEARESEPIPKPVREAATTSTPAELIMSGRMGRR